MGLLVADLMAKLGLDTSGFDRGMTGVTNHKSWGDIGKKTADTGKKMTMGLTLPIVAVGAVAVNMAAKFETSMNQVQAASGASAEEMKGLSDYAMKMGADTMFSAGEAGQAMLDLSKGGMTAAQIKAGGLAASLDLAAAGDLELAQAAEVTIQAMGMFGLKAGQAGAVADALAGGANASTASVEGLADALSQVGPGAGNAGMSLQETVAVLAEFADKGIKGSDAGTSLKTMLANLVPQTDKARHMFDQLGISFTNADGSFKSISEIAQILQDKMGGLSAAERTTAMATLFGSDATRAATILMEGGAKGLEKYTAATNDKTAADKMADARTKGLAGAMESLKGSLETTAIALSQIVVPAMTVIAKKITGVVNSFMGLTDTQKKWVLIAAGTAATAGPLLVFLGKMAQGVSVAVKMYKGLRTAILGVTVAQEALNVVQGVGGAGGKVPKVGAVIPAAASAAGGLSAASIAGIVAVALSPIVIATVMEKTQSYIEGKRGAAATSQQGTGAGGKFYGSSKGYGAGSGRNAAQDEAQRASAAAIVHKMIVDLQVKGATSANADMSAIITKIDLLKKVAGDKILLGEMNGKHTVIELQNIEQDMMKRLGISKNKADKIMGMMFKEWNPSAVLNPKINAAAAATEARLNKLRAQAGRQIAFGRVNNTALINAISQATGEFNDMTGAARTAGDAAINALSHGSYRGHFAGATGAVVTQPTFALIGEAGPEAVVPLNTAAGASALSGFSSGSDSAPPTIVHEHYYVQLPGGSALVGNAEDVGRQIAPAVGRQHNAAAAARARSR